jgi:hypothetical protein
MITLQALKNMTPESIFASGIAKDSPEGINMTNSGKMLRWIAHRGGIHDWAIYCHWVDMDDEWVSRHGDKVHNDDTIRRLVPCDDEAFKMYRH